MQLHQIRSHCNYVMTQGDLKWLVNGLTVQFESSFTHLGLTLRAMRGSRFLYVFVCFTNQAWIWRHLKWEQWASLSSRLTSSHPESEPLKNKALREKKYNFSKFTYMHVLKSVPVCAFFCNLQTFLRERKLTTLAWKMWGYFAQIFQVRKSVSFLQMMGQFISSKIKSWSPFLIT